jgi:hypothetical protein
MATDASFIKLSVARAAPIARARAGESSSDRQICASSGLADIAVAMVFVFNVAWPEAAHPTQPGVVLVGGAPSGHQRGFG